MDKDKYYNPAYESIAVKVLEEIQKDYPVTSPNEIKEILDCALYLAYDMVVDWKYTDGGGETVADDE